MYSDFDAQQVVSAGELALFVSFVLGVVFHEAGHAVVAWLAGLDVRLVSLGQGPAVMRLRFRRTAFVMRGIPSSGYVSIAVQPGMRRSRYVAMVAGGPVVNALLLILLVALDQVEPYYDAVLLPAAVAQGLLLLLTLTPWKYKARGAARPSDGLQLWTQLVRKPGDMFTLQYALVMQLLFPSDQAHPPPSSAAPELVYQIVRSDRHFDERARRDTVAMVRALLGPWMLTTPERAVALDFLASNEVLLGSTGASAAELEAWSAEGCRLAPGVPTTLTRAGVLAVTGQGQAATDLLLGLPEPEGDKPAAAAATFRYWLHMAQAAAARGWTGTAARSLGLARKIAGAKTAQARILLSILHKAERSAPLNQVDWTQAQPDPWGR